MSHISDYILDSVVHLKQSSLEDLVTDLMDEKGIQYSKRSNQEMFR